MDIRGLKETKGGEGGSGPPTEELLEDRMKDIAWEIEMEKGGEGGGGPSAELLEDRMKGIAWELEMEKAGEGGGGPSAELLEDRMKEIAWEIEMEKKIEPTDAATIDIPISEKERVPTREHLLLRESLETSMKWEKAMCAKYTEGQAAELVGRIFENVKKTEFPNELYHNWTEDLMLDAKIGWEKFKASQELLEKYPQQNMEQMYLDDTDEWVMLDC